MIFDTRVNGIPCKCEFTYYHAGTPTYWGRTMEDAVEGTDEDYDFKILDRKGRPAPWLEKYVTDEVASNLVEEYRAMRYADSYYL